MNSNIKNIPYFVSWSGGKDSCLSLFRAIKKHGAPKTLLTMLTEHGFRSRSHGLAKTVLEKQAEHLSLPIQFHPTSWNDYEVTFLQALHHFKKTGIEMGVFGDIKIPDSRNWSNHRNWADTLCEKASLRAYEPLWEENIETLLEEFLAAGFIAKIIAIKNHCLSTHYLGRILDNNLITELTQQGIHPGGEEGEYHTIVIDGPLFTKPLSLKENGCVLRDGYWFLDVRC